MWAFYASKLLFWGFFTHERNVYFWVAIICVILYLTNNRLLLHYTTAIIEPSGNKIDTNDPQATVTHSTDFYASFCLLARFKYGCSVALKIQATKKRFAEKIEPVNRVEIQIVVVVVKFVSPLALCVLQGKIWIIHLS